MFDCGQFYGVVRANKTGCAEDGWDFTTLGVWAWAPTFVMSDLVTDLIMITVGMRGGVGSVLGSSLLWI